MNNSSYMSEEVLACKAISLQDGNTDLAEVEQEIEILKKINHKNCVRLIDTMKTVNHQYLIMDYCNKGDLKSFIPWF